MCAPLIMDKRARKEDLRVLDKYLVPSVANPEYPKSCVIRMQFPSTVLVGRKLVSNMSLGVGQQKEALRVWGVRGRDTLMAEATTQ